MDDNALIDSAVLLGIRIAFFLASRRFLASTLSPTLRDLSSDTPVAIAETTGHSPLVEVVHLNHAPDNVGVKKETHGLNRAAK